MRLGDSLELYAHLTYTTFGMYIICALCTHMYIMYTHVQHVLYIYIYVCACVQSILYVSCTELCKSCIFHVHCVLFTYVLAFPWCVLPGNTVFTVYSKHEGRVLILEVFGETVLSLSARQLSQNYP